MSGSEVAYSLRVKNPPCVRKDLDAMEAAIGASFPEDYRRFLEFSDGGIPAVDKNTVKYKSCFFAKVTSGFVISELLSLARGSEVLSNMEGVLPPSFYPIARLNTGSPLVMCLRQDRAGWLYLWESDHLEEGAEPMTLIAKSFSELRTCLRGLEEPFDDLEPCNLRYHRLVPGR